MFSPKASKTQKTKGIRSPVPQNPPKSNGKVLSPISAKTQIPPQFSSRRPSVQASFPNEAILMLSPSGNGMSFDSDTSLEEKIVKSAASATTVLLSRPISAPDDGDVFLESTCNEESYNNKIASPVANLPFSVPKHHNRKSWALQPAGQMSSKSSIGASKGDSVVDDLDADLDIEIFAMGGVVNAGEPNSGKENSAPPPRSSWETREHARTGSSMWRLFSVLGIHKSD
ncbi:hypothetical protein TrST_g8519 [Triparma strigata]|uniref:Uncharacterized protein n=1 Tax=Triparma strigata TaxID=1606541 RepID=A0A9W7ES05_9STRA|nr:hypothetical protein TrST_g8519 [Triparma strigata]